MMLRFAFTSVISCAAWLGASVTVVGQPADQADRPGDQQESPADTSKENVTEAKSDAPEPDDSPRRALQRMFDASSPAIGSPLPDVVGFDEDGNPLRLTSLKGHHSVIVSGCLT